MSALNAQTAASLGEQVDYDVMCPQGGIAAALEPLLQGTTHFIDLEISVRRGHTVWIRLYPDRSATHRNEAIQHIWGATCYLLGNGKEIEPSRKCTARFNTEVTQIRTEAGKVGILFPEGDQL